MMWCDFYLQSAAVGAPSLWSVSPADSGCVNSEPNNHVKTFAWIVRMSVFLGGGGVFHSPAAPGRINRPSIINSHTACILIHSCFKKNNCHHQLERRRQRKCGRHRDGEITLRQNVPGWIWQTPTCTHSLTHTEHKKNSRHTLSSSQPDKHFVSGVEKKTKQWMTG